MSSWLGVANTVSVGFSYSSVSSRTVALPFVSKVLETGNKHVLHKILLVFNFICNFMFHKMNHDYRPFDFRICCIWITVSKRESENANWNLLLSSFFSWLVFLETFWKTDQLLRFSTRRKLELLNVMQKSFEGCSVLPSMFLAWICLSKLDL